ncbi:hypothetical protein OIO90_000674 [Microbotryomycetes sp. JL221]|nr:hypothetical protein OIO90_000674 [Microbotryomycetes sp. JL221]
MTSQRVVCFMAVTLNCLTAGAIFTFPMWGAPFSRVLQLTASETSLLASAAILGEYVAAAGWGALADRKGPGAVSRAAAVCFGFGFAGLAWRYNMTIDYQRQGRNVPKQWLLLCMFQFAIGCGTAASYFGSVIAAIKSTPARHSGLAIGVPCAIFGLSPLFLSSLAGFFTVQVSSGTTEELDPGRWLTFLAVFLTCSNFVSSFGLKELPTNDTFINVNSSTRKTQHATETRRVQDSASSSLRSDDDNVVATERTNLLSSSQNPVRARSSPSARGRSVSALLSTPSFWLFGALIFLSTGPCEMVLASLGSIVESLLGVRIEPPTTSDGNHNSSSTTSTMLSMLVATKHDPRALALRRLHVQVMSVSNTVSRLVIGLLSDWVSYASEPLPLDDSTVEEDEETASQSTNLKQRLQAKFHQPPRVSRLSFVVTACLMLSATFGFVAFKLDKPGQLWLLSIVVGWSYGLIFTMAPAIVRCVYGPANFGRDWGLLTWFSALGAIVFTPLFGVMLDRAQRRQRLDVCHGRECFESVFMLSSISCLLATGIVMLLWTRFWRGKV